MKENFLSFLGSLQGVYKEFLGSIWEVSLKAFLAVLLITIGWSIAKFVQKAVSQLIEKIDLDKMMTKFDLDHFVKKAGVKLDSAKFLGESMKWIVFVAFFIGALQVLELTQVFDFVKDLLVIIGKIVVSMAILVIAVLASRFVSGIAGAVSKVINLKSSIIEKLSAGLIYFIAVITILSLFEITQELLSIIHTGITGAIFALSLAFGLAFGLGGKEKAKEMLDKMK